MHRVSPSSLWMGLCVLLIPFTRLPAGAAESARMIQARHRMVDEIVAAGGLEHLRVIDAVRRTPRHLFVPPAHRKDAYYDMALPIGHRQTISSPFIVAFMTQALDPQPADRVLEIGTGSGYQAAILSPLVEQVYSIEIVKPLGEQAKRVLKQQQYENVQVKIGDGFQGWEEHAPFDKIIVTCSPESVPQPLQDQLKEGGKLVVPVGQRYQQVLYLFEKREGKLTQTALRPTLFVPMTGQADQTRTAETKRAPRLVNGDFERTSDGTETFIPGWYYQRQVLSVPSGADRDGRHHVQFQNREAGRTSHLLQGLQLDGRQISQLRLGAWVRGSRIQAGGSVDMRPALVVTFYDQQRREVGRRWLGPWLGTFDWRRYEESFPVPAATREAIVRVGLFGATGNLQVDQVDLSAR